LTATDGSGNQLTSSLVVTVVPLPVISSFYASPNLISNGQSSTLNWTTTGTTTLIIDSGVGQVAYNSVVVSPTVTTTYTLTAYNPAGATVTAQTTVTVVLAPTIASFTATPPTIGSGQSSTLSWVVIGATSLSLNNGIGPVSGSSIVVSPSETTTYILTATNTQGSFSASSMAQTTVTISAVPPPTITSFVSSVPSLGVGGTVTLTPVFTPTDGSATATIDQGVGNVTSGVPVDSNPLSTSTTFTLTVTNQAGTATAQVRVLAGNLALFAGSPTNPGYADGNGTAAKFDQPSGIATDTSGNIYVADSSNDVIREITPDGTVSTIAGRPGAPGSIDGTGSAAEFNSPYGVAVDTLGNVYVTDAGNGTIRVIAPGGVVTTLAGSPGIFGNTDGTGPLAQFGGLEAITVDAQQNLYVADSLNCNIRKITAAGVVTTVAGPSGQAQVCGSADGLGSAARFSSPIGITLDSSSNLYVADQNNQTIREISPAGVVTTLAGTPGVRGSSDGIGAAASFRSPSGVVADANGNVYVADAQNYTIRKIAPGAIVTTIIGQAGSPNPTVPGGPLPSQIATPTQVTVDPVTSRLFLTMTVDAIAVSPY
jgi:sugar lactone lactonase YvrE